MILLNSDTVVSPGWSVHLVEAAESKPELGMVGPLSNAASWQSVPRLRGRWGGWAVNALATGQSVEDMAALVARVAGRDPVEVPLLNGFCLLLKRELIESVGLLDERRFPDGYGEETDYGFRAADAGFGLAVAPQAYVYHAKSKSYGPLRRWRLTRRGARALDRRYDGRVRDAVEAMRRESRLAETRRRVAGAVGERAR